MNYPTKVYLAVPYEEKGKSKALGAKWDPKARSWYVPEQGELAPFERWLPRWALDPRDTVRLPVLLLPASCYGCHWTISCVVGLLLPDDGDVEPSAVVDDVRTSQSTTVPTSWTFCWTHRSGPAWRSARCCFDELDPALTATWPTRVSTAVRPRGPFHSGRS